MASYILRKIDVDLWQRVKARLRAGMVVSVGPIIGVTYQSPKDLIESLLRAWLKEN